MKIGVILAALAGLALAAWLVLHIGFASVLGAVPGIAMTTASCSPNVDFESTARALRRPLRKSAEPVALLQELVRCATLAPNGHNTQPWLFELA